MRRAPVPSVNDRASLVAVLSTLTEASSRASARRFLEGLAADELRYIADYLGASVLDPELKSGGCRELLARAVERFQSAGASDADPANPYITHKMMVLLEYLALCQRRPARAVSLRAGAA